jgi:hypothetical protein
MLYRQYSTPYLSGIQTHNSSGDRHWLNEKNVTKNVDICSMCIKTNQVGKQEVGIWQVQKRYQQYGIPICFHHCKLGPSWSWSYGSWIYNCLLYPPLHGGGAGYTVLPLSVRPSIRPYNIFFVAFFSATINGRNLISLSVMYICVLHKSTV